MVLLLHTDITPTKKVRTMPVSKFTVEANKIIQAVEAINLVPSRAGITASEFIRVESLAKRLTFSMASEVYGTTWAPKTGSSEQWVFHVDRASFVPFILASKAFKSKALFRFAFREARSDSHLTVRCGSRKAVFQKIDVTRDYAKDAKPKGARLLLTSSQKSLLRLAARYSTQDPTYAHLNCVFLLKNKAVLASNRIAAFVGRDLVAPMSAPLPPLLLSLFDSDMVKEIIVSKKQARLELICGYICQLINEEAVKDFPLRGLLAAVRRAARLPKVFSIKAKSFLASLERLQEYVSVLTKREMLVEVIGKQGDEYLSIACTVPNGRFEERLRLTSELGQDVVCKWLMRNILPLSDVVNDIKSIDVHYNDKRKKQGYYFRAGDIQVLATRPMR